MYHIVNKNTPVCILYGMLWLNTFSYSKISNNRIFACQKKKIQLYSQLDFNGRYYTHGQ